MDLGAIFLGVCALSLLCVGLLAVAAFFLARFAGTTLSDLLDSVTGGLGGDDASERRYRRDDGTPRPVKADMRARAQTVDFDEALQRYQGGNAGGAPQRYSAQAAADAPAQRDSTPSLRTPSISDDVGERGLDDVDVPNLRSARTTRRRDGYEIYDDEGNDDRNGGNFVDNILDSF